MGRKVSAIIPAYNEEENIKEVLETVSRAKLSEIIVVDDGSEDDTSRIARNFEDVCLVVLEENRGKTEALKAGVERSNNDVLLFLDADLVNLRRRHLEEMIEKFFSKNEESMVLGVFKEGRPVTDLAMTLHPKLTGQRVLSRDLWDKTIEKDFDGYAIEVALNQTCKESNVRIEKVEIRGVTQLMKEEKRGVGKGLLDKSKMYMEIVSQYLKNHPMSDNRSS